VLNAKEQHNGIVEAAIPDHIKVRHGDEDEVIHA
jgi:hypothetical protein